MAVHEEPSDAGGEPASSLEESPSQSIEDSDHHRLENGAQNEADDTGSRPLYTPYNHVP